MVQTLNPNVIYLIFISINVFETIKMMGFITSGYHIKRFIGWVEVT